MNEIEVRKPMFSFIDKLKYRWYGYSKRVERWQKTMPDNGDKIKLTWLPNPINAPFEKSVYIGSTGVVFDMDKAECSFCLELQSGATLIHPKGDFNYIMIKRH